MNERNIEMLKARLLQLGFDAGVEARLRKAICFSPKQFDLRFKLEAGRDNCLVLVHCIQGDRGLYDINSYTAVLRKAVDIPEACLDIDTAMQAVEWPLLWEEVKEADTPAVILAAVNAFTVLEHLRDNAFAGLLTYKHWIDTPLEHLISNLSQLKAQHEILQRFYVMEDQQLISCIEAIRFLQSRWMERKLQADRKLLGKKDTSDTLLPTGSTGGKLLAKRVRANRKPGIHKS